MSMIIHNGLLGNRCLVRMEEPADKIGLIVIPDKARYEAGYRGAILFGTVELIGRGKLKDDGTREQFEFAVGDRVGISAWSGTDYFPDGGTIAYKLVESQHVQLVDES